MRNRILPALSVAVLLLSALATPVLAAPITFANAVLADNPIAYWRFGEAAGAGTAADAASGHDGTYFPGVTAGQAGIGGGDTGALFDGISGSVTVPNDPELGPDLITMEALVRWDGPNAFQQRILEKSFFTGGEQASYGMSILPTGAVQVEIRSGGAASSHTTLQTLLAGDEAYLVGVYDGSSVFIYLDGLLLSQTLATPGALQDGLNPLGIGNQSERNRPFNGLIDEVALYDYALSANQIGAHFDALSVPEPDGLALLWIAIAATSLVRRKRA
jgi:hypothetical protein